MVYKRRRKTGRRKFTRKRSTYRRRSYRRRKPSRRLPRPIVRSKFVSWVMKDISYATGTANVVPYAMSFSPSDCSSLANFNPYIRLFDECQLAMVKVEMFTVPSTSTVTNNQNASFIHCNSLDFDDAAIPIHKEAVDSGISPRYSSTPGVGSNRFFKRLIKPKVLTEIYRNSTSPAYQPRKKAWLDTAYPDSPHYGMKGYFFFPYYQSATVLHMFVMQKFTYYIKWRGTRFYQSSDALVSGGYGDEFFESDDTHPPAIFPPTSEYDLPNAIHGDAGIEVTDYTANL